MLNAAEQLVQSFYTDAVIRPQDAYKAPHAYRGTPRKTRSPGRAARRAAAKAVMRARFEAVKAAGALTGRV